MTFTTKSYYRCIVFSSFLSLLGAENPDGFSLGEHSLQRLKNQQEYKIEEIVDI